MTNTTHISVRGADETSWIDSMLAFFGLARRSRVDQLEEELEQVTNDYLESLSESEDIQLQVDDYADLVDQRGRTIERLKKEAEEADIARNIQVANLQAQLRAVEPLIAKERLEKLKSRSEYREHLNPSQIAVYERSDRN